MRQYNSYHSRMAAYLMDISPSHSLEERLSNMREQMACMRCNLLHKVKMTPFDDGKHT